MLELFLTNGYLFLLLKTMQFAFVNTACPYWIGAPQVNRIYCFENHKGNQTYNKNQCFKYNNATLASLDTADKTEMLKGSSLFQGPWSQEYWIGLDRSSMGWQWQSKDDYSYTNWESGYPKNDPSSCVFAWIGSAKWRDSTCDFRITALCEQKAVCSTNTKKCFFVVKTREEEGKCSIHGFARSAQFLRILEYDMITSSGIISDNVWFGLKRNPFDSKAWIWNTGATLTYSRWADGHPKIGDDCAVIGSDLKWYSTSCTASYMTLCQTSTDGFITLPSTTTTQQETTTTTLPQTTTATTLPQTTTTTLSQTTTTTLLQTTTTTLPQTTTTTLPQTTIQPETTTTPPQTTTTPPQTTTTQPETTTQSETTTTQPETTTTQPETTTQSETTTTQSETTTQPETTTQSDTTTTQPETTTTQPQTQTTTQPQTTTTLSFSSTAVVSSTFAPTLGPTSPFDPFKVKCPSLTVMPRTHIDTTDTSYATVVTVSCDIGYHFDDGTQVRTLVCTGSAQWSSPLPICKAVECLGIGFIKKASVVGNGLQVGSQLTYICDDNLRMRDGSKKKTIMCSSTGNWTDTVSDCGEGVCPPVPLVLNAEPNTTMSIVGTTVEIRCMEGFLFPGDKSILHVKCTTFMKWTPLIKHCYPIICPPPPVVNHTTCDSTLRFYGTVVTYTCVRGYRFSDDTLSKSTVCTSSRNWNATVSSCKIVSCPMYPEIANASWIGSTLTYGSIVNYTCVSGFRFIDGYKNKSIVCNENKTWSETNIDCRPDRCVPVPEVENASPSTRETNWHTKIDYTCHPGHRYPDGTWMKSSVCTPYAVWTSTPSDCLKLNCTPPKSVQNSNIHVNQLSFGSATNYTCFPGFIFSDNTTSKTVTCSEDRLGSGVKWNPELSDCHPVYCPQLVDIANATRNTDDTVFNTSVVYTCFDGFEFVGTGPEDVIRCKENAAWDHDIRECVPVRCKTLPTWADTLFNSTNREYKAIVSYNCTDGFAFADKTKVKTSECNEKMIWSPPIEECRDMTSITADLTGVTWEAENAVSIGLVALLVVACLTMVIVILDLSKILNDMRMMKRNIANMIQTLLGDIQVTTRSHKIDTNQRIT